MKYRPEVDGLRAIAVLSVVLCHAGLGAVSGGFAGVDVFFVISGFLITRILADDLAQGQFSLWRFYERRARRILPALLVMLLVTVPFALWLMVPFQIGEYAESVTGVGLFISNITFLMQSGYFANDAAMKPLLHTWSLAVEEQFYILYPLLLWLVWRAGPAVRIGVLAVLAVASLAASEYGWRAMADANFYLIPFRAWELLAGALAAFVVMRRGEVANDLLALPGLAMILVPMVAFDETVPFPSLWTLIPVAGTAFVLTSGTAGSVTARILGLRPMVAVGLISYSVYLWHQPLLAFARLASLEELSLQASVAIALLSLPIGWASWAFVERPFRGKSPLLSRRVLLAGSALALLAVVQLGRALPYMPVLSTLPEGIMTQTALDQLREDRFTAVLEGDCHQRGKQSAEEIVQNPLCLGRAADGTKATVALYGDSHAADTAGAIRLAGGQIAQVTGATCPLLPGNTRKPLCDTLMTGLIDRAKAEGIHKIILANLYTSDETDPERMRQIVAFWRQHFDTVYLVSPTPVFARFDEMMLRQPKKELAKIAPIYEAEERFGKAVAGLDQDGVVILDGPAYFCGDRPGCTPVVDGPLLVDRGHMSVEGMKILGVNLLADPKGPFAKP